MPKESPLLGYTEIECYTKALRLREIIGPKGRMTAKAAGKRVGLQDFQTVKLVRNYFPRSMIIEPYGQTARIFMRPLKSNA